MNDSKARRFVNKQLGDSFVEDTEMRFESGLVFKSLQETNPAPDEIFFKVGSRSSRWKKAQYHEIRAIIGTDKDKVTREWCFVAHVSHDAVSLPGDSGASLIDSSYRPIAMVWGGRGKPWSGRIQGCHLRYSYLCYIERY